MSRKGLDCYEVLGVPRSADTEAIRKAYRALARKYHPDVSDDPEAHVKFSELSAAYEILRQPRSRLLYDVLGYAPAGAVVPPPRRGERGGGRAGGPPGSAGPGPQRLELVLDPVVARRGGVRTVQVASAGPCPDCADGGLEASRSCTGCSGTGRRPVTRTVRVRVPPGTRDGSILEPVGPGAAGRRPEPAPVVVVRVAPFPDARFVRYSSAAGLAVAVLLLVLVLRMLA